MFLHVALGVLSLAVSARCVVDNDEYCKSAAAIQRIQKACRNENEAMLNEESAQNYTEMCRQFPLVMKCSVKALPHCYEIIEKQYSMYGHSPYACKMSSVEVMELQKIISDGIQTTQLPTSTAPTTAGVVEGEQSGTTFLNILPSSTSRSSQKVTRGQAHQERREGDNTHGHDDGTSVTSNISTMAVLLVVTPLLWWRTS